MVVFTITKMTEFLDFLNSQLSCIDLTQDGLISGFVNTEESYTQFLNGLKIIGYSFTKRSSRNNTLGCKSFTEGTEGLDFTKDRSSSLCFEFKSKSFHVPFSGQPFQREGITYFECTRGKQLLPKKNKTACNVLKPRRRAPSRRIGCSAKMIVSKIRVYPDYTLEKNVNRMKRKTMFQLKEDIKSSEEPPSSFLRYLIALSPDSSHNHAIEETQSKQKLIPELVDEIYNLVRQNVKKPHIIKTHLNSYVKQKFHSSKIKPDPLNSAYYPTLKTIYNHARKALIAKDLASCLTVEGGVLKFITSTKSFGIEKQCLQLMEIDDVESYPDYGRRLVIDSGDEIMVIEKLSPSLECVIEPITHVISPVNPLNVPNDIPLLKPNEQTNMAVDQILALGGPKAMVPLPILKPSFIEGVHVQQFPPNSIPSLQTLKLDELKSATIWSESISTPIASERISAPILSGKICDTDTGGVATTTRTDHEYANLGNRVETSEKELETLRQACRLNMKRMIKRVDLCMDKRQLFTLLAGLADVSNQLEESIVGKNKY